MQIVIKGQKDRNRKGRFHLVLQWMLAIVMFFLSQTIYAQWTTQSPLPTHLDVRGVGAPTADRIFIATADNSFDDLGALFESGDGGITWQARNVPASLGNGFNGLIFIDSQNGWAFGNENYRTTDGGTTWEALPFLGSTYSMKFATPSVGVAGGNFGHMISRNGGLTWESSPNEIFTLDFFDPQIGLGISANGIYRTTDGGITFSQVLAGNATAVAFLSSNIAVGIIDNNFVRSIDGGVNWSTGSSADGRSHLQVVSTEVVLAWGRSGSFPDFDDRVFRSGDGGQSWTDLGEIMDPGTYSTSFAFAVPDLQTVVATDGAGNMFQSTDAGISWSQTFTAPGGVLPGFFGSAVPVFPDAANGYFGYGAGFVIKSTDGGASWLQISSGTGKSLNDIARFDNGDLIAVGDEGTLLTNSGGNSSWLLQSTLTSNDIVAVDIINASEVVIVDETGQVYKSADSGNSWIAASAVPPGASPAEDIRFSSFSDGWIIGQGFSPGVLHHTTDGGESWTTVPDFMGAYVAVDAEGTNIWAANVTGLYYRSTDGGLNWESGNLPGSPLQIQDMDFYDANIGYAVGWWGDAFRSNDGGVSWETLPTPNGDDKFTDIYLLGPNELWLSTTDDVAYYSATGGQNWAVLDVGSAGFGSFRAIAANPTGDAWMVGGQGYIEYFMGPPPPPLNRPPDASFDYNSNGLSVDFTDTSSDPDGSIVSWQWDFGDGNFSTAQNPSHTFLVADTYIVRLTVTDDDGDNSVAVRFITVQPNPGGTFGDFTEVTPLDSLFVTPQDEDFWVITTAPADFDSDGDLDIAVLGYYVVYNQSVDYRLVLLRNDGAASAEEWEFVYIDVPLDGMTAGASDLAWADVDNDGDPDLAIGSNGATVIYRNDAGILQLTDTQLPSYWEDNDQADFDLRSITWADYDNDGDPDLLLPSIYTDSTFSFRTALMRNDGPNGTGGWIFSEVNAGLSATTHAQSAWADFDNDQDLDLLLVNIAPLTNDGFIRRYRNDGNGVFVGEDILGNFTVEHGEVQWGDYDADGDLDILVGGRVKELNGTYQLALRIYRNDNETYTPIEVIPCVPCEGWFDLTAATWADYDTDGDMDILLAGNYNSGSQIEGRARVYDNLNGVFSDSGNELPAPRASGDRGGTFSWFDLDGEGDLDYFIAGTYFVPGGNGLVEAQMHAYRNDAAGQNNAPSAPSGLNATVVSNGRVQLSWSAASDDFTPAAALTYELSLFHNGAPLNNGRRLPEPGNISAVTEWLLDDLPDGQYEWQIQAVDAAYNGSPAGTGTFNIGITGLETGDHLPETYTFAENYPNPFNPSTTFKFSLPEFARVELSVYNLRGQLVENLVNDFRPAGVYELRWNAQNLASGFYLVRLSTAKFTLVRKITLLK